MAVPDPKDPTSQLEPQPSEDPSQADLEEAQEPAQEDPEAQPDTEEAAEVEAAGGADPAPKPAAGHKRQGGYQRQIERLRRQNEMLLEQLQRGGIQPTGAPPKPKTPEEQAAEQFERLVDQRLQQREAERQQQAAVSEFQRRAAEARAKHDDWDDAISTLDIPTASPLGQALLTSEQGPDIMYHLATNPAELARISALPPIVQAREIGRLEGKTSGAIPQTTSNQARRPPAPPSTVSGNAAKPTRRLEDLPIAEYKKARRMGRS